MCIRDRLPVRQKHCRIQRHIRKLQLRDFMLSIPDGIAQISGKAAVFANHERNTPARFQMPDKILSFAKRMQGKMCIRDRYVGAITHLFLGISSLLEALGTMRENGRFLETTFTFLDLSLIHI